MPPIPLRPSELYPFKTMIKMCRSFEKCYQRKEFYPTSRLCSQYVLSVLMTIRDGLGASGVYLGAPCCNPDVKESHGGSYWLVILHHSSTGAVSARWTAQGQKFPAKDNPRKTGKESPEGYCSRKLESEWEPAWNHFSPSQGSCTNITQIPQ